MTLEHYKYQLVQAKARAESSYKAAMCAQERVDRQSTSLVLAKAALQEAKLQAESDDSLVYLLENQCQKIEQVYDSLRQQVVK